jgi:hypothetical protein
MPVGTKRRSPTWQQSLLLLFFGVIIGYPSFVNLSLWGRPASQYQGLYIIGFFVGAVAFLSGFASFLAISVKAVTSPAGSRPAVAAPSRASLQTAVPGSAAAALTRLRITLAAVVTLACIVFLRDWGRPSLTSSYGRYYWLNAFLTLLLSQLPFAIALVRIWKAPDRAGLALAMIVGAAQVLGVLFHDLPIEALLGSSSWLGASLGLAAVIFAYMAWKPFFSRKGDAGLLTSIVFGFFAYTWLTRIAVSILYSRELVWMSHTSQ